MKRDEMMLLVVVFLLGYFASRMFSTEGFGEDGVSLRRQWHDALGITDWGIFAGGRRDGGVDDIAFENTPIENYATCMEAKRTCQRGSGNCCHGQVDAGLEGCSSLPCQQLSENSCYETAVGCRSSLATKIPTASPVLLDKMCVDTRGDRMPQQAPDEPPTMWDADCSEPQRSWPQELADRGWSTGSSPEECLGGDGSGNVGILALFGGINRGGPLTCERESQFEEWAAGCQFDWTGREMGFFADC